jgi:hypothetical protein
VVYSNEKNGIQNFVIDAFAVLAAVAMLAAVAVLSAVTDCPLSFTVIFMADNETMRNVKSTILLDDIVDGKQMITA